MAQMAHVSAAPTHCSQLATSHTAHLVSTPENTLAAVQVRTSGPTMTVPFLGHVYVAVTPGMMISSFEKEIVPSFDGAAGSGH
jgi:hypothetical protein